MKTPQEAFQISEKTSGTVSGITRQLDFAEIAIIWMFKIVENDNTKIHPDLVFPAILILSFFIIDILQYIYVTVAWSVLGRLHEVKSKKKSFHVPCEINWPTWSFWVIKLIVMVVAQYFLLRFLWVSMV